MIKVAFPENYWPWHAKMCLAAVVVQTTATVVYAVHYVQTSNDPDWKLGVAYIPVVIALSGFAAFVYPLVLLTFAGSFVFFNDRLSEVLGVLIAPALLFTMLYAGASAIKTQFSDNQIFLTSMVSACLILPAIYISVGGMR